MTSEGVSGSPSLASPPRPKLPTQLDVLRALDSSFELVHDQSYADLVHPTPRLYDEPYQRWFRYRESFAPELITKAIAGLEVKCTLIVDPFCGVGSTLLAARASGIPSIGFDVNPIVTTVARAKTANYSRLDVAAIRLLVSEVLSVTPDSPRAEVPQLRILDQVFRADVRDGLLAARKVIDSIPDAKVKGFMLTGFLAVLENISNVFKEGNGIKYRNRKRTSQGYVTVPWESIKGYSDDGWSLVRSRLSAQYQTMLEDIEEGDSSPVPLVNEQSSVTGLSALEAGSVSLSVFSPPYCNNFNYMKIFKVELWMSGLARTYAEIRQLNASALRSHVEMKIDISNSSVEPAALNDLLSLIDADKLWNRKIPSTIIAYFVDMRQVLIGLHAALARGGEAHIVVGNSAYGGVVIPTDVLLAQIGRDLGFDVARVVITRHLTTSSQQRRQLGDKLHYLRESIIVLRRA